MTGPNNETANQREVHYCLWATKSCRPSPDAGVSNADRATFSGTNHEPGGRDPRTARVGAEK